MIESEISFIIPIYNKKIDLVKKCVQSVKKIHGITYEIILVDDGSTHTNSKAYKKIARIYSCRYFYQNNKGVSSARNLGIKLSTGKYIFFLDADDKILSANFKKEDFLTDSDLVIYNVQINNSGNKQIFKLENIPTNPSNTKILYYSLDNGLMNWSVAKLYSRKYLIKNNIWFNENIISGEDFDFVTRVLFSQPRISYYSRVIYVYLIDINTGIERVLNDPLKSLDDEVKMLNLRKKILKYNNSVSKETIDYITDNTLKGIFEIYQIMVSNRIDVLKSNILKFDKILFKITKDRNIYHSTKVKVFMMKHHCFKEIKLYIIIRNLYKKLGHS